MVERYHEGLPEAEKKGWKLSGRVKDISKAHRIDARQALARFTVESILWSLQEVSNADFMVKGGLLHAQIQRQTDDGDIAYFAPRTAVEIYGDVGAAAAHLRQHGILWSPGEVKPLDMGGKGSGYRIPIRAKIGPTRIDTHLDVGFGALPEGAVRKEFRSMFKGPSFMAWAQPWEAVAADKFAAVITLGMGNTRLKDYRDLLMLRGKGLDDRQVARALHRTMRERKADTALLLGIPDGLSFEYADKETWAWRAMAAADGGLPLDFLDVVCSIRHWYADIQQRLVELAAADALEPRSHVAAPPLQPTDGNVYSLDAYRLRRA